MRGDLTRSSARIRAQARAMAEISHPQLELSSLVDVAFLLLTFFILTSTLDPKEADLGFNFVLPGIITQPQSEVTPEITHVVIKADGSVWCEEEMTEPGSDGRNLPHLRHRLAELHAANQMIRDGSSHVVSIRSADEVKGQRFIDVLNCLSVVGIDEVQLEGFRD